MIWIILGVLAITGLMFWDNKLTKERQHAFDLRVNQEIRDFYDNKENYAWALEIKFKNGWNYYTKAQEPVAKFVGHPDFGYLYKRSSKDFAKELKYQMFDKGYVSKNGTSYPINQVESISVIKVDK